MRPITRLLILIVVFVATVGWSTWQRQRATTVELRQEVARLCEPRPEMVQPVAENRRLKALQATASDLKKLSDDQEAAARLRSELEAMEAGIQARMRSVGNESLKASLWTNAGTAAPSAAAETVLWTAAGGDIDALVDLLSFTPEAQAKAEAVYEELPASARAKFASPEHLIASFTARDVPLTAVSFGGGGGGAEKWKVIVTFYAEDGTADGRKQIELSMIRSPRGWRLLVPESAVDKYAAQLKGTAVGAENKLAR